MRNNIGILLLFLAVSTSTWAGDSITSKRQAQFIAVQLTEGFVLPTNKIAPGGESKTPSYSAMTLKYGLSANGDRWEDDVFCMPYRGIAAYIPRFSERKFMGDPFSVFLFQGARLKPFSSDLSLHYEINLGVSFNWEHYDVYERPWFLALGSSTNAHIGGSLYLKWKLSRQLDLNTGVSVTHFSNGALRTPNHGLNAMSAFVEMICYMQPREEKKQLGETMFVPPVFRRNTAHDLTFMLTTRTLKLDERSNGLISKYPDKRFTVAGINYSYMFHDFRRFMWGPSIETVYDESANVTPKGEINSETGEYREVTEWGKVSDRFSIGLSLKGEVVMPGYSIFANLGYDVLHPNDMDQSFYQIYGLKVYLANDLFATLGVRSTNLTRSQYLYLNLGYTFKKHRKN